MSRYGITAAIVLLMAALGAAAADAQTPPTVRVTRDTVVLEQPRGDSLAVGRAAAGAVYQVVGRRENWLLVLAPETGGATPAWLRGWIHLGSVEVVSGSLEIGTRPRPRGRFMVRGFGQTGGVVFDAHDSFDTLVGSSAGLMSGAGGQVVFPSGVYVQVSVDRFRETGSRVLVSGNQFFTLDAPTQITVTPILATVGYRSPAHPRFAPYLGGGVGLHRLREEAPLSADRIDERKAGVHVVGGVELPVARFLAIAGEAQYASVPKALGETGLSAVYGEENLGGATSRFKVLVGF
jgi:hypothetical protein